MCILKKLWRKPLGGDWLYVMKNRLTVVECAWCGHIIAAQDVKLLKMAQAAHDRICEHKRYVMSA